MEEAITQKSISENTRTIVLIIFCVVCWGILWNELEHFIWKIVNISFESMLVNFTWLLSMPPEMKKIMEEILKKGLIRDFYWPHFFFIITAFLLVPLVVGFYAGRHSKKNKFLNCFFIVVIVTLLRPILGLFSDADIKAFLLTISLKGYFICPFLFMLASSGALIGGFFKAHHDKGLYLTIYRDILEKRRKGIIFVVLTILIAALSFKGLEKQVEDVLSPYYRYAYAKVVFSKDLEGHPLLRVAKPTTDEPDNWPGLTSLNDGDALAFIISINNSNFLYSAVNTKLSLMQNDAHQFTAVLWADNATPVQQSIKIAHNCSNPVFSHIDNKWYFVLSKSKQSLPMPSGQTGLEVFRPTGINLGNLPGMYAGTSNFVIKFNYACPYQEN